jgi:hypothetical protein
MAAAIEQTRAAAATTLTTQDLNALIGVTSAAPVFPGSTQSHGAGGTLVVRWRARPPPMMTSRGSARITGDQPSTVMNPRRIDLQRWIGLLG